ncbi:MAG: 4a-hydroxytetrahydrobiopterin dehydratase [Pseudomonadota bacterium]|nr:4a-hydroxytetrahydrobiopterin dehydratase [Pseudomonadota bacterium]
MERREGLADRDVVRCAKGTPPLTEAEYAPLLAQLPDWDIAEDDGIARLQRSYAFDEPSDAIAFSRFLSSIADEADHHPFLIPEGNRLTVIWWTHSIRGLHLNDFIMAARSDEAYGL